MRLNDHLELRQLENGNYHLYLYDLLILNGIEILYYTHQFGDEYWIYLDTGEQLIVNKSSTMCFYGIDKPKQYYVTYDMSYTDNNSIQYSEVYKHYIVYSRKKNLCIFNTKTSDIHYYPIKTEIIRICSIMDNIICLTTYDSIILYDIIRKQLVNKIKHQKSEFSLRNYTISKGLYYSHFYSGSDINNDRKYHMIGYDFSGNIIFKFYIKLITSNNTRFMKKYANNDNSILFISYENNKYILDTNLCTFKKISIDNFNIRNYKNDTYYNVKKGYKLKTNLYKIEKV